MEVIPSEAELSEAESRDLHLSPPPPCFHPHHSPVPTSTSHPQPRVRKNSRKPAAPDFPPGPASRSHHRVTPPCTSALNQQRISCAIPSASNSTPECFHRVARKAWSAQTSADPAGPELPSNQTSRTRCAALRLRPSAMPDHQNRQKRGTDFSLRTLVP